MRAKNYARAILQKTYKKAFCGTYLLTKINSKTLFFIDSNTFFAVGQIPCRGKDEFAAFFQ